MLPLLFTAKLTAGAMVTAPRPDVEDRVTRVYVPGNDSERLRRRTSSAERRRVWGEFNRHEPGQVCNRINRRRRVPTA